MEEFAQRQLNTQVMMCPKCGFLYNPIDGDEESNIDPYTDFADIPQTWACPICDGAKDSFVPYMGKLKNEQVMETPKQEEQEVKAETGEVTAEREIIDVSSEEQIDISEEEPIDSRIDSNDQDFSSEEHIE